ncbi:probable alpha,alpha-trehalose-phosphate synthase [UDP-forming] 7 [Macadamia integrifolia]|uniref:probable alpha,alpha-trehalose-phosphate synthase [UDP-forming] 7 n=1 Tax=Macadamia integrifolia TaxID=60698 RepID=UPI001C4F28F8|nr:probable alpha,alpha-trehalose-phosphate synthase [UDP-forming] 7 [Macadamia integrifolia]
MAISMPNVEQQLRHKKHYRVATLDPNFKKLSIDSIVSAYSMAKSRAILLDYDGTVMPQTSINKTPSHQVISILNTLCGDDKNTVFIVSGRGRESLGTWFSPYEKLGIAAEHGYFLRWSSDDEWKICGQSDDFGWMEIAEPSFLRLTNGEEGFRGNSNPGDREIVIRETVTP